MPRAALIAATFLALGAAACADAKTACEDPIFITLHANNRATLDGQAMPQDDIVPAILARYGNDAACRVMVKGDKDVEYGGVMKLMNALQAAGYAKVALVAEEVLTPD